MVSVRSRDGGRQSRRCCPLTSFMLSQHCYRTRCQHSCPESPCPHSGQAWASCAGYSGSSLIPPSMPQADIPLRMWWAQCQSLTIGRPLLSCNTPWQTLTLPHSMVAQEDAFCPSSTAPSVLAVPWTLAAFDCLLLASLCPLAEVEGVVVSLFWHSFCPAPETASPLQLCSTGA